MILAASAIVAVLFFMNVQRWWPFSFEPGSLYRKTDHHAHHVTEALWPPPSTRALLHRNASTGTVLRLPRVQLPDDAFVPAKLSLDRTGGEVDWPGRYVLEGGLIGGSADTIDALAALRICRAGWYCLSARAPEGPLVASGAFVLRDPSRGDSEYGVPPSHLQRLPFYPAVVGDVSPPPPVTQTWWMRLRLAIGKPAPGRGFFEAARHAARDAWRSSDLTAYLAGPRVVPEATLAVVLAHLAASSDGTPGTINTPFVRLYTVSPLEPASPPIVASSSYTAEFTRLGIDCYHGWGSLLLAHHHHRRLNWLAEWRSERAGTKHDDDDDGANNADRLLRGSASSIRVAIHSSPDSHGADVVPEYRRISVQYAPLASFKRIVDGAVLERGSLLTDCAAPCLLHVAASITISRPVVIPAGSTLAVAEGAMITVKSSLHFQGQLPDGCIFITRSSPVDRAHLPEGDERNVHVGNWGGIIVEPGGEVKATGVIFAFAGGSVKRPKGTGSHIKEACPIIAVAAGARLTLERCALVHSRGPGVGAGAGAAVTIRGSFFNDLAQGGECVSCRLTLEDSVFSNFMLMPHSNAFVDRDNDGFYVRGGQASIARCAFVNALDDCIDSASSKGDSEHSRLTISDTLIANCVHEGIALSSSVGTTRDVVVRGSLIAWAQQGVENGHSAPQHTALLEQCSFLGNIVAVRHGDSYRLPIDGKIRVERSMFYRNHIDVLSHERHIMRSKKGVAPRMAPVANPPRWVSSNAAAISVARSFFAPVPTEIAAMPGGDGCTPPSAAALLRPPVLASSDPLRGVICGARHFQSDENTVTHTFNGTREGLPVGVGCTFWRLCVGEDPLF